MYSLPIRNLGWPNGCFWNLAPWLSGSSKLTSTSEGRNALLKTSQSLNDELLNNLSDYDLEKIQYHVKTCYTSHKRKGERNKQKKSKLKKTEEHID